MFRKFSLTETLRKYPAVPFISRVCTKDYKMRDTDVTIEKGVGILVPLLGLHHDPQYFPDPQKFDPERFSGDNITKSDSFCHLPFGEGPRNCIGKRCRMS